MTTYISHPFRADPVGNAERVRRICEALKHERVPLAPHLLLPTYIDEATERDLAMAHRLRLVAAADEVQVFGEPSDGIELEIAEAGRTPRVGRGFGRPSTSCDIRSWLTSGGACG